MKFIVRNYVTENPDVDYEAIVKRFGKPAQIAKSYVEELDSAELLDAMHIRKKVLFCVIAVLSLMMVMRFAFLTSAYFGFKKDMQGYAVVEVIEYDRTEINEGD